LIRIFLTGFCALFFPLIMVFGTHNRAGEISYVQLSDVKIQIIITTYTKASSTAADRDSLVVSWGDGNYSTIARSNGSGDLLSNNTKRNYYIAEHSYPGRASYVLSVMDPNRVENILNIDPPNSVNIPFYIQTNITLLNLQFQTPNRSVKLLQAPIDFACVGVPFQHNPAAFDEDGDSLSFEFTVPLMDVNTPVPNYSFPNQIQPGIDNQISLDPQKGTFTWISPKKPGEYNIAFIIHEYRKGVKIASTIRDMQIFVRDDCNKNRPPTVQSILDTCIVAGQLLDIPVIISDADTSALGSYIKAEATGVGFFIQPSMEFLVMKGYQKSPLQARLRWQTNCTLVRKEYYTVVIKATDNILDSTGISTLYTIRIKVTGPAPTELMTRSMDKSILLEWKDPYDCDQTPEYFRGFSVWRKENASVVPRDTCQPGLQGKGYQQIAYLTKQTDGLHYFYTDSSVKEGKFYCYRVQGEFATTSSSGFPINFVSSLHSEESCNTLPLIIPVMLQADVQQTDSSAGKIHIKWTKPLATDLNIQTYPPPYEVKIFTTNPFQTWTEIPAASMVYNSYNEIWDTNYLHSNINTLQYPHQFRVLLQSGNTFQHISDSAQSIFTVSQPKNNALQLRWEAQTPWNNYQYDIFLLNRGTNKFDSIASTSGNTYLLTSLQNDSSYCYYIRGNGEYGVRRFESPLLNKSNIRCDIPRDNEPPCCPSLRVEDPCKENIPGSNTIFNNKLIWTNPSQNCSDSDIAGYKVYGYYEQQRKLIAIINDPTTFKYEHTLTDTLPDCYGLTSFDYNGNECLEFDTVCLNYCPIYNLPNTFTPNQDGHNDVFKPFPYRFVNSIDLKIFNRWGNLVFNTKDPDILWDGKASSGTYLPDGSYYYTCKIFYSGLPNHLTNESINGFIELRRGK